MTRELRDLIRQERDKRTRERAFENVCLHCLTEFAEDAHPYKRYCDPGCRNMHYALRRKLGLPVQPVVRGYATDAERLEARRRTWRTSNRRRYAARQGINLAAWDAGKVAA
jgi:hypothetical protein